MEFSEVFKPGDVICSDRFRGAICMIVEKYNEQDKFGGGYFTCIDLLAPQVLYPQKWCAHEFDTFKNEPNHWRIATDDDIVNHFLRYFHPSSQGPFRIEEDGLRISTHEIAYLTVEETVALKDYLNKWIIE